MDCREIKALLPEYVDGELEGYHQQAVRAHVQDCPGCRRQLRAMEDAWKMLGELGEVEPHPNYLARFWARVDARRPWHEQLLERIRTALAPRRMVPVLVSAVIIIAVGFVAMRFYPQKPVSNAIIAGLDGVDLNMIEQMDMIEELDVLQEIDFLSDLEIMEVLDELEAS